jgi:Family of unknown function (DUF6345)
MTESSPTMTPPAHSADTDCGCGDKNKANGNSDNPFDVGATAGDVRGGAKLYGAFSIETFCDQGALSLTHDDADGFLAYVRQFNQPNFWYQDGGVKVWAYYEDFDNWQDTYGMDAVKVAYHSGHGGMDGNGVFYAPMGAAWAGNDCTAVSSNMRLGNESLRYLFWSTCQSLRVFDGHSPIRTWQAANLGFRMLFGFETVSYDNANYGRFFWEEWGKGKSFSQAWLDSSWRIAHNQAPTAMAVGATSQEAADRLNNERSFFGDQANTSWWQWRWYFAASAARTPLLAVPQQPLVATIAALRPNAQMAAKLADRFSIGMPAGAMASDGSFQAMAGDKRIFLARNGAVDVQLARHDHTNRGNLSQAAAQQIAQDAISHYELAGVTNLAPDTVLHSYEAGGSDHGSGTREDARITSTVVQFRQTINGIPVISPDAGTVRVTVDNGGTVSAIHSSLQMIQSLSEHGRQSQAGPKPPGTAHGELAPEPEDYQHALAMKFSQRMARWAGSEHPPVGFTVVPDSTEIGYDIQNGEAVLVARRTVEVDFGQGYRKRYFVTVPLA